MRKKLICLMLSLLMFSTLFAGCNLVENNYQKDYAQVVAIIKPISDGRGFESKQRNIYKYEVVDSLNQNGSSMVQEGSTVEEATNTLLDNIINRYLILVDIDRMVYHGELTWRGPEDGYVSDTYTGDWTDANAVRKYIYEGIDSTLTSLIATLYTNDGLEAPATEFSSEEAAAPTYPLMPNEEIENGDENDEPEMEAYVPEAASYPGLYGSEKHKKYEKEALRQLIARLKSNAENAYVVTDEDKAKYKEDDNKIKDIINKKGISYVYPELINMHFVQKLIGVSAYEQGRINILQSYFDTGITVSDDEAMSKYDSVISTQEGYTFDEYKTAMEGSDPVYYHHANTNYFYVKHILLPFDDATKADLENYKANYKAGKNIPTYEEYRERAVNNIKVYPHKDGEDDTDNPTTVDAVFDEVKRLVASRGSIEIDDNGNYLMNIKTGNYTVGNLKEADRAFTEMIYKYNTDPGIFGNALGYNVTPRAGDTVDSRYMKEFSEGAADLYEGAYVEGTILENYVITDYGVHIMYYSSKVKPGAVPIDSYQSPSELKTYREIIKESLLTKKIDQEFDLWQKERIAAYREIDVKYEVYSKKLKNLYR